MIDHVSVGVSDFARSMGFYDETLATIGIKRLYGDGKVYAGYGVGEKGFFWLGLKTVLVSGIHIAFTVEDRATVDRFHAAGLASGGRDYGGAPPTAG